MELRAEDIDKVSMTDMDVKAVLNDIKLKFIIIGLKYDYTSFTVDNKASWKSSVVTIGSSPFKKRVSKGESIVFILMT